MSLNKFLNNRGFYSFEGHSQEIQQQVDDLIKLTNKPNITVLEIGFNAGHSADIFLQNNKELTLTSFDLGKHSYVITGKRFIDVIYPTRHKLVLGDSKITIPKFIKENNNIQFDVIFIDGANDYETVNADIKNCFQLAHKDTIVIVDDTIFRPNPHNHTYGPSKSWSEHLEQNKIVEINRVEYKEGRGMSWGKYVFTDVAQASSETKENTVLHVDNTNRISDTDLQEIKKINEKLLAIEQVQKSCFKESEIALQKLQTLLKKFI